MKMLLKILGKRTLTKKKIKFPKMKKNRDFSGAEAQMFNATNVHW